MPDYRLYELDAEGEHLGQPQTFFATSDKVAIRHAEGQGCAEGCELWEGERFVAAVRAKPPNRRKSRRLGGGPPLSR